MLKYYWEKISASGLSPELDHRTKKRIRITSQIIVLAASISLIFSAVNAFLGYFMFAFTSFGFTVICALVFILHTRRYHDLSRFGVVFVTLAYIAFFSSIHGKEYGSQFFLFPVIMGLFAIFSIREYFKVAICVMSTVGVWLLLEGTNYSMLSFLQPAASMPDWSSMLNFGFTLITTLMVMYYFTRETRISEQEVIKNQQHLQSVINSSTNGIWLINRNYELLVFNKTFADWCMATFGKKIAPGDNLMKLFDPDLTNHKETFKKRYDQVFNTGEMLIWEDYHEIGDLKAYLEIVLNPIIVQGEEIALSGYARDMTQRKHMETELKNAKTNAEEASRAKTVFLSKLSHELRTPLNAIYGLTQVISRANQDPSQAINLNAILESTQNLTVQINNLLDFSLMKDGPVIFEKHPFSLRDAIGQALRSYELNAEQKQIRILREIDPNLPEEVNGDAARFIQVLSILVDNAVKFTNTGEVRISINLLSAGNKEVTIRGTVKDNGPGIPEELQDDLFESFEQADNQDNRKFGGIGLGLPIAKKIIQAQGGSIHCNSIPGEGSEFIFELPFLAASGQPKETITPEHPEDRITDDLYEKNILIVDDNAVNRLMAKQVLKQLSFINVSEAEGGNQALELFEKHRPAVILLDIQMPEMDGYEVASRIRSNENGKTLPIIALSADILPETKKKAKASGMDDFIEKPLNIEILKKMLAKYMVQG